VDIAPAVKLGLHAGDLVAHRANGDRRLLRVVVDAGGQVEGLVEEGEAGVPADQDGRDVALHVRREHAGAGVGTFPVHDHDGLIAAGRQHGGDLLGEEAHPAFNDGDLVAGQVGRRWNRRVARAGATNEHRRAADPRRLLDRGIRADGAADLIAVVGGDGQPVGSEVLVGADDKAVVGGELGLVGVALRGQRHPGLLEQLRIGVVELAVA
jgi:hypothetical protein